MNRDYSSLLSPLNLNIPPAAEAAIVSAAYISSSLIAAFSSASSFSAVADHCFSSPMGYDLDRFVGHVNEDLLCSICRDVLEDPLQAPCEHAYCRICIEGWLVNENTCPEDRQALLYTQLKPLFRYMRNDLNRLRIRCKYSVDGCDAICALESLASHESSECQFKVVECPSIGCEERLRRCDIEEHISTCEYKTRECQYGCGFLVPNTAAAAANAILSDASSGATTTTTATASANNSERILPTGVAIASDHNCIAELRNAIDHLRTNICLQSQEQRHDIDLRLDAHRRYMVTKEEAWQSSADSLRLLTNKLSQDMQMLKDLEKVNSDENKSLKLQHNELLEKVQLLQEVNSESQQNIRDVTERLVEVEIKLESKENEISHLQTVTLNLESTNESLSSSLKSERDKKNQLAETNRNLQQSLIACKDSKCAKCKKKEKKSTAV